ncbi:phosphoglycerate kinase [Blochmannia endosymbiont of Colobopsis nipponica]|uniref:phosphoglycerate kinase n=1 Tax=Blochmannia endosymbiont of Colobopsis nipponica TaxID=2681987 RepID=UPI001784D7C2|nr:phosphoglycerate kinase [Blochmannia endosymbiont of Colobopsis nipponica]QOI11174.1 phosphoglycerate kinase [Blochmannia endosymbiont of Colobopsis nipponica]
MDIIKMSDLDLMGKRVLIRSDLNVPIKEGVIVSDIRIRASLPTILSALKQRACVMVASHLGRPTEGEYDSKYSLGPVAEYLKIKLAGKAKNIRFVNDYLNGLMIAPEELVILENVRFNKGERKDDELLAKKYAELCDVFVMDAFGVAHRTQASTHALAKFAPISCGGRLLISELETLSAALKDPLRPMVAIVGGSKVSTKLTVLDSLSQVADYLVIGGGIANTFIAAQGNNVGKSLYEEELLSTARQLLENCDVPMPVDVRVSTEFSETACGVLKSINDVKDNEQILDLGDVSIKRIMEIIKSAKTILWNGPVGVFEFPNFRRGTESIARAIAQSDAFSIAGGGDTLMAINLFGIADQISCVSTGGGAFLEFIEGKRLPSISILEDYGKIYN